MDKSKLTFWCNNAFLGAHESEVRLLKEVVGERRLLMFAEDDESDAAHNALRASHIAFGYPSPGAAIQSESLRWIQLNSAGYTSYDHDEIKRQLVERGIALTNSSSVYDEPCAEHLLAMITSLARQLPAALHSQSTDRAWEMDRLRASSPLLNGQTVLILGFGAIARRLVELLAPLRMNLIAIRRHVKGTEPIRVEDFSQVDRLLPIADHIVNILPANDQTKNFLNATRFAMLKPGAIVYNIGRGVTLDQDALRKELDSGRLRAAYLDVTDPEPLPPSHPLWTTRNCYITPHSGGGHSTEKERQVKHFLTNLERFELGKELIDRVL